MIDSPLAGETTLPCLKRANRGEIPTHGVEL
jgi:hypothetical protein